MTAAELRALAPRLCRAWEQQQVLGPALRRRKMKAERLVAHRELQLVRAYSSGDRRYIVRREAKPAQAQRELRRAKAAA